MRKLLITALCICAMALYGCAGDDTDSVSPSVSMRMDMGSGMPPSGGIGFAFGGQSDGGGMPGPPPDGSKPMGPPPDGFKGGKMMGKPQQVAAKGVLQVKNAVLAESGKAYTSTDKDVSAVLVGKGGSFDIKGATVTKTGEASREESGNFFGVNAGILVADGGQLSLADTSVTTDAKGSNAVVSTGEGSVVTAKNPVIRTAQNSSRGLHATLGGVIKAENADIETKGDHSAALATDRGGGTVTLAGGSLKTEGQGSPAIYSTGNISVSNVTAVSTASECAVIEGKNSAVITDSSMTCAAPNGVMLYQSFSGDAEKGESHFSMKGGSLTSNSGAVFYTTNTRSVFDISDVAITNKAEGNTLFKASANRWGKEGMNGAQSDFNLNNEKADGDILCDGLSSVKVTISGNSVYTGAVNSDKKARFISVTLDSSSKWVLTEDSHLSEFHDAAADFSNIISNGHNIYYDSYNSLMNSFAVNKKIVDLPGGGKLLPSE